MRIAVERRAISFRALGILAVAAGSAWVALALARDSALFAPAVVIVAGAALSLQTRAFLILGRRVESMRRLRDTLAVLSIRHEILPRGVLVPGRNVTASLEGAGPLLWLRFILGEPRSTDQDR